MAVRLTSRPLWQVVGHILLDNSTETRNVEVFTGVGFYARPHDNGRAEAIVIATGGSAGHFVAIATRDEDTRKKVAADLAENETQMHNDVAILRIKADGSIEARTAAGVAVKLPTLADVTKIGTAIAGATIAPGDGGASLKATISAGLPTSLHGAAGTTTWPVGTTKFKAE